MRISLCATLLLISGFVKIRINATLRDCTSLSKQLRLLAFKYEVDRFMIEELDIQRRCAVLDAQCAVMFHCLAEKSNYNCAPIIPYKTTYVCSREEKCRAQVCLEKPESSYDLLSVRISSSSNTKKIVDQAVWQTDRETLLKLFDTDSSLSWAMICYITLVICAVLLCIVTIAVILMYCTACGHRWRERGEEDGGRFGQPTASHVEHPGGTSSTAHDDTNCHQRTEATPETSQTKPPPYHSLFSQFNASEVDHR